MEEESRLFSVSVVGARRAEKEAARYAVRVTDVDAVSGHVSTWTQWRRYSDLRALRDAVAISATSRAAASSDDGARCQAALDTLPPFPPRLVFGSRSAATVAARTRALDTYLAALSASPLLSRIGLLRWALQPPAAVGALTATALRAPSPAVVAFDAALAAFDATLAALASPHAVALPWRFVLAWRAAVVREHDFAALHALADAVAQPERAAAACEQLAAREPVIDECVTGAAATTEEGGGAGSAAAADDGAALWREWVDACAGSVSVANYLRLRFEAETGDAGLELEAQLDADVPRTFPDAAFAHEPRVETVVRRVVTAWVGRHPEIGYQQGMIGLAVPLVFAAVESREGRSEWVEAGLETAGWVEGSVVDDQTEAEVYAVFERVMDVVGPMYVGVESAERVCARVRAFSGGRAGTDGLERAGLDLIFIVPRWLRSGLFGELPARVVWPVLDAVCMRGGARGRAALECAAAALFLALCESGRLSGARRQTLDAVNSVGAAVPPAPHRRWLMDGADAVLRLCPETR